MTRKQRNAVAVATTVLTLAGGGGVAWACTGDPGYPGSTGTTTSAGTTTSGTSTPTTTTSAATTSAVRRSQARRARHSRRNA